MDNKEIKKEEKQVNTKLLNIDVGNGSLLVKKDINFKFNFKINQLNEDANTKEITQIYDMSETENDGELKTFFNKRDWKKVNAFEYDDENKKLNVIGIPSLRYKFKVEFTNVEGKVLQVIKNYEDNYIKVESRQSIEVPINLITTSVNSYFLVITVITASNEEIKQSKEVILINKAPIIIGKFANNRLYLNITDEQDTIRYNVLLNGKQIYPDVSVGNFTGYEHRVNEIIKLTTKDIKVNKVNTITVNAEDNWGGKNVFTYEFKGEYFGLLFTDEDGEYYSTDIGKILKRLDFKQIIAGRMSDIKSVYIYNNMGLDIKDLKIMITPEKKPEKLTVLYGFDDINMQTDDKPLIKNDIIKDKEKIPLYLQLYPDIEFEYREGIIEISAIATSM